MSRLIEVVCSLKTKSGVKQSIPPGPDYTIVRFPFDGQESSDSHDLHPVLQPDTAESITYTSPRAGLIWPAHTAWADLYGMLYWDAGNYTELRDRFVRDPLNLSSGYDSTCTEDHNVTPGGSYIAKAWGLRAYVGTPLALMVKHNSSGPVNLAFAEFKVKYTVWEA